MSAQSSHGSSHGTMKSYMIGFGLSVILTVIPFALVMGDMLSSTTWTVAIIFALGGVQMLVHLYYFLHVSLGAEQGWQAMSMIFAVILLVIIMVGSVWVMTHLEENMMPAHDQIERVLDGQ